MMAAADYTMWIGGKAVAADETREVHDPATGELIGRAPIGTKADVDRAVAAAGRAQAEWGRQPDEVRADACRKLAGVITQNSGELARLLTREQGKPLKGIGSEFELGGCAAWMGATAEMSLPVKVIQDDEAALVEQHYVPVGVVGSITPWNWPLLIAIWHIAPAIRAGNAVVIKPSPYTTLSTLRMVELLARELPDGLLSVVADGPGVGEAMTTHPQIDKIMFTGSTATGRRSWPQLLHTKEAYARNGRQRRRYRFARCRCEGRGRGNFLGGFPQQRPDLRRAQAALCSRRCL